MATTLEKYAVGTLFLNGQPLFEEMTFDLGYATGNAIVVTQMKKFAGVTQGAGSFSVKVTSAVPLAGLEVDFHKVAKEATVVTLVAKRGGKVLTSRGFIMNVNEKYGVNTDSTMDFDFVGEVPEADRVG